MKQLKSQILQHQIRTVNTLFKGSGEDMSMSAEKDLERAKKARDEIAEGSKDCKLYRQISYSIQGLKRVVELTQLEDKCQRLKQSSEELVRLDDQCKTLSMQDLKENGVDSATYRLCLKIKKGISMLIGNAGDEVVDLCAEKIAAITKHLDIFYDA